MRWMLIVGLLGCGSKGTPLFEGPMPIELGACATTTTNFVSGPRPVPFTPYEAAGVWNEPAKLTDDDPPPPPPSDYDEALARQQAIEAARSAGILGSIGTGALSITGGAPEHKTDFGSVGAGVKGPIGFGTGVQAWSGSTGIGAIGMKPSVGHLVPTVSIGKPGVDVGLDKAIIRRYIKRNIQKIQYCYEKELLGRPRLAGRLDTHFRINEDGTVSNASGTGVDPKVASCVVGVLESIEFPKPQGGGGIQVNYPFIFRAAGADDDQKLPVDGGLVGSADVPPPGFGPGGSARARDPVPVARDSIFRPETAQLPDSRDYSVGMANPLREATGPLEQCFRRNPTHVGAVVVDFTYDSAGHVTSAITHGLDDKPTIDCVIAIAKQQVRATPAITAERCGLVFGRYSVDAAPGIDLEHGALKLDGKVVQPADLEVALRTPIATPIAIHGPRVVRVGPSVDMKSVYETLNSIMKADNDFVLAVHRDTGYELFYRDINLPVAPVPRGIGARWNRVKSPLSDGHDAEEVVLSVLVTKQGTYVGVSRINEFTLAATPDKLADMLKEQKASAFFSDRTDIEIAADREMTYADLTAAIDIAMKAGFTDFQITDPEGLAAPPTL